MGFVMNSIRVLSIKRCKDSVKLMNRTKKMPKNRIIEQGNRDFIHKLASTPKYLCTFAPQIA